MRRRTLNGRWHLGPAWSLGLALSACAPQPAARTTSTEAAPVLVDTALESASSAPPSAAPPSISTAPEPPAPAIVAVNDRSLTLAVYRAAGVPDVDHAWSAAEYQRCLEVFVELLRGDRNDLPRAGSTRSGALFARLVDPHNFDADAAHDAAERARHLHGYLDVFPGFLKVYSPASDGVDFSMEQGELIIGLLELLKSALASSLDSSRIDASWAPEYERQKAVTLGVFRGAATVLTESERYSADVRRRLRAELARLAPELERHLDVDAAREVHGIAFPRARAPEDSEPLR